MDARIDWLQRVCAARPHVIGLSGGLPAAELFPCAELSSASSLALEAKAVRSLQYGWPEGDARLREWIARRIAARGVALGPGDVIVTAGAQQALAIAAEVLLRPGDDVEVDPETYPAALDLFRHRGAHLVTPIPLAPGAIARRAPAFAYVMSGINNPRGTGMAASRERELCAGQTPLVVDEAYAELRFDGATPRLLLGEARERVWHIGTFSKTLCPGLRVGFLVPPPAALDRALAVKRVLDLQACSFAQAALADFLARDDFDARLARTRRFYARRAERLLAAVRRALPSVRARAPEGGLSLWVETDEPGDDTELLALAAERGVSFDPGRLFRPSDASSPIAMRLCFSAASPARYEDAAKRLARALTDFLHARFPRLKNPRQSPRNRD